MKLLNTLQLHCGHKRKTSRMDQVPFLALQSYNSDFQTISTLGNGSFGTVVLAKYRHPIENLVRSSAEKEGTMLDLLVDSSKHLGSLVAIKTMNKRLSSIEDYTRVKEYRFIISIPLHPSLVQIYQMFIDSNYLNLHIVMETMNQNLYQLMKSREKVRFSSVTLKSILRQLADGIRHIHRYGYFHRDIKPENILVCHTQQYYCNKNNGCKYVDDCDRSHDNFVVKIADYGLARHVNNTKPYTEYVSTRWYRSPEILLRKKSYSKPVDIWAFGAVAVEIATFRPLFPGTNELDQIWKILEILGSPSSESDSKSSIDSFVPFGGYWEDGQVLSCNLGFVLPSSPGVTISQILHGDYYTYLGELVQRCLTWNPDTRANIEEVCNMSYFNNTKLSEPYKEPSTVHGFEKVCEDDLRLTDYLQIDENIDPIPNLGGFYVEDSQLKLKEKKPIGKTLQLNSVKNGSSDNYQEDLEFKDSDIYFSEAYEVAHGKNDFSLEQEDQQGEEESIFQYNGFKNAECNFDEDGTEYIQSDSQKIGIEYSWEVNTKRETQDIHSLAIRSDLFEEEDSEVERPQCLEVDFGVGDISIGSIKEISC